MSVRSPLAVSNHPVRFVLVLLMFSFLFSLHLLAKDVIIFKSGRTVKGKVVKKTKERVQVDMGAAKVWFSRSDIKKIVPEEEYEKGKHAGNKGGNSRGGSSGGVSRKGVNSKQITSEDRSEIKKLARKYVKNQDDSLLKKLEKHTPAPGSQMQSLARSIFEIAYSGPKHTKKQGVLTVHDEDYPGEFYLTGVKPGKKQPLLVGLHGGGTDTGTWKTSKHKWRQAPGMGAICAYPEVLKKVGSAWNKKREEKYVIALIKELIRSYKIDTNRIYLVGHSMGGFGTWSIGSHQADRFAGLISSAGGIFSRRGRNGVVLQEGILENLMNTPIYFIHSTDDPHVSARTDQKADKELDKLQQKYGSGYEHLYKEYNNIGHGDPPGGMKRSLKWLFKKKRNPYPKELVFEQYRNPNDQLFWLKVTGARATEIHARIKGNTITIKGADSGFTLFLNDKLIDPGKPVKVVAEGDEIYNKHAPYSVRALLESVEKYRDPNMYYTMRIEF